ncbi:unnamed protein product, partial [Pocillopora meandrina]
VLAISAALNIYTFPFAILLNSLVIVAVKTNRRLRTKSNISLACLATTDFAVGLIVQPLVITNFSLFFIGSSPQTMTSTFVWVSSAVGQTCTAASLLHLLLMSGERYLAIKHPFAYENGLVTEARIIIASNTAWICAAIAYGIRASIFREITFNTTVVIVLTLFLCYIPIWIWLILFIFLNGENASDVGQIAFFPIIFLQALNSSINPLIYTARIRHFRVAFFQMVMRKTLAQAEKLEKKMFGANRVGIRNNFYSPLATETTADITVGLIFQPLTMTNFSLMHIGSRIQTVTSITTALNIFTCPFAILLNSLVLVAVKTKRNLRTKSNISLACLATTDFAVGLIVQPLAITFFILFLIGSSPQTMTRIVVCVSSAVGETCIAASLLHLLLMSGERYLAIKHPFAYENGLVTEARIIIASGMAWTCAAIIYGIKTSILRKIGVVLISAVISAVVYCHVVIYKEVRRNTQQIIANQVSLAVKEKLLNNKRAFKTTVVIVLTLFLCYIPTCIWLIVFIFLDREKSVDIGHIAYFPITFLVVLNSSINPLIYTARMRHFRLAFFQMLTRKTF